MAEYPKQRRTERVRRSKNSMQLYAENLERLKARMNLPPVKRWADMSEQEREEIRRATKPPGAK